MDSMLCGKWYVQFVSILNSPNLTVHTVYTTTTGETFAHLPVNRNSKQLLPWIPQDLLHPYGVHLIYSSSLVFPCLAPSPYFIIFTSLSSGVFYSSLHLLHKPLLLLSHYTSCLTSFPIPTMQPFSSWTTLKIKAASSSKMTQLITTDTVLTTVHQQCCKNPTPHQQEHHKLSYLKC